MVRTLFFTNLAMENLQNCILINLFKPLTPYINKIKTGKVLDIGCAYVLMLKRFPASFEKFGIDVSDYAIHIAKTRFPSMTFRVSNSEDVLPFPEEAFDIYVMMF